jgi:hypothetical protein
MLPCHNPDLTLSYSLVIADSHPLFLRDDASLAYKIRRYRNRKVTIGAASTTSSKVSSPLPFISFPVSRPTTDIVASLPVSLESKSNKFEVPETSQKKQPPANTRSVIEVEPMLQLRTDRIIMNSAIDGKTSLRTHLEMMSSLQQNTSFGEPFIFSPPSAAPTFPRIDYSGLVDDDDSSIESIEEIPSDYLVDLEQNAPSNFVFETSAARQRESHLYEI